MIDKSRDTEWEAYTQDIDRRTYHGRELFVILLPNGHAGWFVDSEQLRGAESRELARQAAEFFVTIDEGLKP